MESRKSQITVRDYRNDDLDDVADCFWNLHKQHATALPGRFRAISEATAVRELETRLSKGTSIRVAETGGRCAGYYAYRIKLRKQSALIHRQRFCYLEQIYVRESCRKRGVARNMLADLRRECTKNRIERIEVDTWTFNRDAKALFISENFLMLNNYYSLDIPLGEPTASTTPPGS